MKAKNIIRNISICVVFGTLFMVTSCAREISSNVYSADHVGEASVTYSGVITHARQVDVEDSERLQDNGLGIIGGGVGGALAGSQIGRGRGNTTATIGGALAGATIGAIAEKAMKRQTGMEYIVQLDNNQTVTIVQGPNPTFYVGQQVYVLVGQQGRSRLIPR